MVQWELDAHSQEIGKSVLQLKLTDINGKGIV